METVITIGLAVLGLYLAVGVGVAGWLHAGRLRRMDGSVVGAGWVFRVLITPGLVALWPVLLRRSAELARTGGVTSPYEAPVRAVRLIVLQRLGTQLLAVLAPIALVAIVLARPPEPRLSSAEAALIATSAPHLQSYRFPWDGIEARWTLDAEGHWELTVGGTPTAKYTVMFSVAPTTRETPNQLLSPDTPRVKLGAEVFAGLTPGRDTVSVAVSTWDGEFSGWVTVGVPAPAPAPASAAGGKEVAP